MVPQWDDINLESKFLKVRKIVYVLQIVYVYKTEFNDENWVKKIPSA